jgi:hypothetical protein
MGKVMGTEISKSRFKAQALEFFRQIETTGTPVIITDHGKPTLEIRRLGNKQALDTLRGSVIHYAGATEPVAEDDWENAG